MAKLLDGKTIAAQIEAEVATAVTRLNPHCGKLGLSVVIVGNDPASELYIRNKEKACQRVGIHSEVVRLAVGVGTAEVVAAITALNQRSDIHGILVQQPLPTGLDSECIIESIDPGKDVDGFHPMNLGRLIRGLPTVAPCTPAGIMRILDSENVNLTGTRVTIVGRSTVVGKPVAMLCLQRHATVTMCHSRSGDLTRYTKEAEVLIVATGNPNLIRGDMVSRGVVIIDVGMNRLTAVDEASQGYPPDSKEALALAHKGFVYVGDVYRPEVEPKASLYTPVPGGVGQVTVAMLLLNTVTLAARAEA